jgi:hypothetical protein
MFYVKLGEHQENLRGEPLTFSFYFFVYVSVKLIIFYIFQRIFFFNIKVPTKYTTYAHDNQTIPTKKVIIII